MIFSFFASRLSLPLAVGGAGLAASGVLWLMLQSKERLIADQRDVLAAHEVRFDHLRGVVEQTFATLEAERAATAIADEEAAQARAAAQTLSSRLQDSLRRLADARTQGLDAPAAPILELSSDSLRQFFSDHATGAGSGTGDPGPTGRPILTELPAAP